MFNPHQVTREFEKAIAEYTGAPYVVALDNASNALFLALKYYGIEDKTISIPSHTYPSVPCEIIHAGGKVNFTESENILTGMYCLEPTPVIDSALRFTADMYVPGTYMCISFTNSYKHVKMGCKSGAILTDDEKAYKWFKKARFSGRAECSYHDDDFDSEPSVIGWNFYLSPDIATRGLILMNDFYDSNGNKKHFNDISLPYPDLSKFKIFKQ